MIILGATWMIVFIALWFVQASKPTPEKLNAYILAHPIENLTGADRQRVVRHVTDRINRLNHAERRRMQSRHSELRAFFYQLTSEEQDDFLNETLPSGFRELMRALNKMTPAQREKMVKRALDDMQEDKIDEDRPFSLDDPHIQKMIESGLESFYRDASIETKLDFAPVIEAIQAKSQKLR